MYQLISPKSVKLIESNTVIPEDTTLPEWMNYQDWLVEGNTPLPIEVSPVKTVLEVDTDKYMRRATAKNLLMAEMAAMNIGRLKSGTWTTAQLVSLMQDPEIKSLVSHMETLSFELAIGVIQSLTNPLITVDIKSTWISKLQAKL